MGTGWPVADGFQRRVLVYLSLFRFILPVPFSLSYPTQLFSVEVISFCAFSFCALSFFLGHFLTLSPSQNQLDPQKGIGNSYMYVL